jgi:hypothetical protein
MGACAVLAAGASAHAVPADLGDLLIDRATLYGNELGQHVSTLTGNLVGMRFDVRQRRAHVSLGGGGTAFGLHLDGDGQVQDGGYLRVHASVDLDLAGGCLHVKLPTVDMAPTDYFGHQQVIVRLPIFETAF